MMAEKHTAQEYKKALQRLDLFIVTRLRKRFPPPPPPSWTEAWRELFGDMARTIRRFFALRKKQSRPPRAH